MTYPYPFRYVAGARPVSYRYRVDSVVDGGTGGATSAVMADKRTLRFQIRVRQDVTTNSERRQATEDHFLGALMGMAIGDALGMPVVGLDAAEIGRRHGEITAFLHLERDGDDPVEAGEVTDETEIALTIVESATTMRGVLDPDLIGPRMVYLAEGQSAHWLGEATRSALLQASDTLVFTVPLDEDGPATADVASRGIPVGLLHAVGRFDADQLRADAETVTRITHGSPAQMAATTAVAFVVQMAARRSVPPDRWLGEAAAFLQSGRMAESLGRADNAAGSGLTTSDALARAGTSNDATEGVIAGVIAAVREATFDAAVLGAVNAGGKTDTVGAIAGAIAGAYRGASDISQPLIDALGSRIYVSLSAPWFRRAAMQRAGMVIELRAEGHDGPPDRPLLPPH